MTFSKVILFELSLIPLLACPIAWSQTTHNSRPVTLDVGGVTSGGAETEAKFHNLVPERVQWMGVFNDSGARTCGSWAVSRTWVRPTEPDPSPTAGWTLASRCLTHRGTPQNWSWIESGTHSIRYPAVWAQLEIRDHGQRSHEVFRDSEISSTDRTERFATLNNLAGGIALTLIRQFNPGRMATLTEYVRFLSWAAALPLPDFRMVPATELTVDSPVDRYLLELRTQQLAVQRANRTSEVSRLGPYVNVYRLPSILFLQAMQTSADRIRVLLRQLVQAPSTNRCESTNLQAVVQQLSGFTFYNDAQIAEWRRLREFSAAPNGTPTLEIPEAEASRLRGEIFSLFGEIALSCLRDGINVPAEALQLLGQSH